jgi:hypothetical protein
MKNEEYIRFRGNSWNDLLVADRMMDITTLPHAREIQKERAINNVLGSWSCYTSDFVFYRKEKGKFVLGLADGENNLIIKNLYGAVSQFSSKNHYFPDELDMKNVVASSSTLVTDLSELRLKRYSEVWDYLEFSTTKYDDLNNAERTLAEKIHGSGNDFIRTMNWMAENEASHTMIYVYNADYIAQVLKNNEAESFAIFTHLGDNDSYMSSFGWNECSYEPALFYGKPPHIKDVQTRDLYTYKQITETFRRMNLDELAEEYMKELKK